MQVLEAPPVEPSPAGDIRNRSVPCAVCRTPTFNHSGRCDNHLEVQS